MPVIGLDTILILKKESLFQIDWLKGEKSPLIERIELQNPETGEQTSVHVGSNQAFEGLTHISGIDWGVVIDLLTISQYESFKMATKYERKRCKVAQDIMSTLSVRYLLRIHR